MTPTQERHQETFPDEEMPARLGGTDVFRGSLVILAAVIIGGLIISRGLSQNDDVDAGADTTVAPAATAAGDGTGDSGDATGTTIVDDSTTSGLTGGQTEAAPASSTTVTTQPVITQPRSPAEVKVLVLNGAQTQGIAARGTELLKSASYNTAAPKNANTQRPSAVFHIEGFEAEAAAVAQVFGPGLEGLVRPLDPADPPTDDTQGAAVIVVIGTDDLIPIS